jgi:hypothetical protein
MDQPFKGDAYRPINWRRRVLLVLLAVATAVSLLGYMLGRRGDIVRTGQTLQGETAACKPGQTAGCVGGMATVIVAPAASGAAAAAR